MGVANARFAQLKYKTDHGFTSMRTILLNKHIPYTEADLRIALLHEALHYFAERARPGNPVLTEEVEHVAMAMLGDRDEQVDYFEKYWNIDINNENWLSITQRKMRKEDPTYMSGFCYV